MQYLITPFSQNINPFVWWEGAFNDEQLTFLRELAKKSNQRGLTGHGLEDNSKIRRSNVSWINYNDEMDWLFQKLSYVVSSLNSQFYNFDIVGFGENLQLTNYDHSENGMYGWHQDYGLKNGPSRKLSLVLQLTDPSDYEGGNLQIMYGGDEPKNVPKKLGLIVVFPSYQLHQVTPVTQGSRQSLVAWITGPNFK